MQAGLPSSFDFALHARGAIDAFIYVRDAELLDRQIQKNKRQLAQLLASSESLVQQLELLDSTIAAALIDTSVDMSPRKLGALSSQLSDVSNAAKVLLRETAQSDRGRKSEAGLAFAIRELYSVFHDQFPDEVGHYRKDESEHGYAGRFFDLVRLLLPAMGIERSPAGIEAAIRRSLRSSRS